MSTSLPAISVVIPTYNYAHLIHESLESVYAQTFTDYEIIVVDDGSTDSTRDVLKPHANRITYHYQENQGLSAARNTGMRLARGKYLTYLDADDIWHPDNLRIKYNILTRIPDVSGVFSDFLIFSADGISHPRGTRVLYPFFRRTGLDFKDIFQQTHEMNVAGDRLSTVYAGNVFDSLFWGNFILPTTMIINRAHALSVGDFRPHLRTQEDYEYWLRFSRDHTLAYVEEVLVQYRRHPQQLTDHSKIEPLMLAVNEIIDVYQDEFQKAGKLRLFNSRKAGLLINLAKVYIRQGKSAAARTTLQEAIRRDPGQWEPYVHLLLSLLPYRWLSRVRSMFRS